MQVYYQQPSLQEKLRPQWNPLRTSPPSKEALAATEALVKYLDEAAPLESDVEREARERLLIDFRYLTSEWVKEVCIKRGVPEEDAPSGRIFISGSYRLAVNQPGGDIDVILVVPNYVDREVFFSETVDGLVGRLRKHPKVSHVLPISTARVPIIKVTWAGIEMDVLFARLNGSNLPDETPDSLLDDVWLVNADEATVLSLNGPRVTELIIKVVPDQKTFTIVLRSLRLWGKRRGIYSNKIGFLGGINFAILAAFICQLYPKECAANCVSLLFSILQAWQWPTPIRLNHPYDGPPCPVKQWNENDYEAKAEKMPIITPAYPNTNSSFNVSKATLLVMQREFERGLIEARRVVNLGKAATPQDWAGLFQETDFFFRFKTYVSVVAFAQDEEGLKKWTGFVESRLRKLVEGLERSPLYEVFPFPKAFDAPDVSAFAQRWFIGICIDPYLARSQHITAATKAINLEGVVIPFLHQIQGWEERAEGMNVEVLVLKFKDMVKQMPDLYPMGIKASLEKYLEVQKIVKEKIEAKYTKKVDNLTESNPSSSSTTTTDGDARLQIKKIKTDTVDLTTLKPLLSESHPDHMMMTSSSSEAPLMTLLNKVAVKAFKVVDL